MSWMQEYSGVLGVAVLLLIAIFSRIYAQLTLGVCRSTASMKGKTVMVTGANSGIGKETARDLVRRGAKVIMACRDMKAANQARDEIVQDTGNGEVTIMRLDLSSFKSIREFADDVNRTVPKLDVLIHNAGCARMFGNRTTEDGLELTMGTNHYGSFLLTHLLIDLLRQSAPCRIIVVSSALYRLSRINLNNANPVGVFPVYLYYMSKYANIMFANELARRLQGTGITVNSLHPGMIDSGIWRNIPFPFNVPLQIFIKGFAKTSEEGAQTTIELAVSETLEGVSGRYFSDCKESTLSKGVQDRATAKKLWELSEKLVGLRPSDPHI